MVKENLAIIGRFQLFEDDKLIIDKLNLVTIAGSEIYANILSGDISLLPDYLGVDFGAGTYVKETTTLFNEALRKKKSNVTSPSNKSVREFVLSGNEAIGQIYGFGLMTAKTGGAIMNLLNQEFLHQVGKTIKILWSIEVKT